MWTAGIVVVLFNITVVLAIILGKHIKDRNPVPRYIQDEEEAQYLRQWNARQAKKAMTGNKVYE